MYEMLPQGQPREAVEKMRPVPLQIDPYQLLGVEKKEAEGIREYLDPEYLEQFLGEMIPGIFPAKSAGKLAISGLKKLSPSFSVFRPGKTAENFTIRNMEGMLNKFNESENLTKSAYAKYFPKYGENMMTANPKSYLGLTNREVKKLFPDAKDLYKEYLNNPTPNNLHELQSQIGADSIKTKAESRKQIFKNVRNKLVKKQEKYAKSLNDEEAYEGLLEGKKLTRDVVEPFKINPTIKKIVEGNIKPGKREFEEIEKAVMKANEAGMPIKNSIGELTGKKIRGVPQGHYLDSLQKQLEEQRKIIDRRKLARNVLGVTGSGLGLVGLEELIRRELSNRTY